MLIAFHLYSLIVFHQQKIEPSKENHDQKKLFSISLKTKMIFPIFIPIKKDKHEKDDFQICNFHNFALFAFGRRAKPKSAEIVHN
jgi:hypothetical protein